MPEGSVSAVTSSITKLNERPHRGPGAAASASRRRSSRSTQLQARRARPGRRAPGGGRRARRAASTPRSRRSASSCRASGRSTRKAHPEVQKVAGPDRRSSRRRKDEAGDADRGRPARGATRSCRSGRPSSAAPSTPQKAQAATQSRKARGAGRPQEGGGVGQEPLRGPAPEAQRDRHRGLHPQQQRERRGARPSPPTRPVRPDKKRIAGAWPLSSGLLAGRRPRARPRLPGQHHQGPGGDRALPPPRPAGRGAAYDEANVHFVTEAYQNLRTALIFAPQGRARAGRARHRHRAPGRQDHHPREPGQAARLLGREGGRASTSTCAAASSTAAWA